MRKTFATTLPRPASLWSKWNIEVETSSKKPATFVPFETKTDDHVNSQTYSSSTTLTVTTPQTLSPVHRAPLMDWTPAVVEITQNAPKIETSSSASSTATESVSLNPWTLSALQMTDLKTETKTLAADIYSSSLPAVTTTTTDSPPATTVATDTNVSHNATNTDSTTTGTASGSTNTDFLTRRAILIHTVAISTTTAKASGLEGISVQCRVAAITVTISQDFLAETDIQESDLYLGSQECGVNGGNATHVQLTVAWQECSTRLVHVGVIYIYI